MRKNYLYFQCCGFPVFFRQVNLSHSKAFAGIHNGEYWGVIEFGENFTSYLTKR